MTAISQTKYLNAFSRTKIFEFWLKIIWSLFQYHQEYAFIGSDDGLAPIKRQAIIWTNDV